MWSSQLWLLAASAHLASADWALGQPLDYRGGQPALMLPRQTQASTHDGANGWTPRPTDGPSIELVRRRQAYMKLRRQGTTSNTWVDATTCGWIAGDDSEPFTCDASSSCATNTDQVVGCTSSKGENPFFTVCLDYNAVKAGACSSVGTKTGCCMTSSVGECVTYLWPGSTVKSMFRCYTERTVYTMLSAPQSVIDGTSTTSSSSSRTTGTSTNPTAPAQTTTDPPASTGGSSNTGAIVGGVVGGVGGIALIAGAIAFFIIRSRKHKNNTPGAGTAYSAVAPGDTGYHGSGGSPMQHSTYPASTASPQPTQTGYFSPNPSTLAPDAAYQPGLAPPMAGAYDPRTSYYDPAKPADQQHYGQTPPPPGGYGGYPAPYPPQQPVSELDTSAVPAGHQSNPAEMADTTQR